MAGSGARSVRLGDPMAPAMAWAGALFVGALAAMVVAAFVLMMRHALGSGEAPMQGLGVIGGMGAGVALLAFALRKALWTRVHRVDVRADGAWTLRNPLGVRRAFLRPDEPRVVEAATYRLTTWDGSGHNVDFFDRAELVVTAGGARFVAHTNEFPGVLARLGYDVRIGGAHLENAGQGRFRVPLHGFHDGAVRWL